MNPKTIKIPLRIVFYYEEDCWVARCLEFDLIGCGESKEESLQLLSDAICIQLEASIAAQNPSNLFCPSDGKYLEMWARGKHVAIGELQIHRDNLEVDGVDAREFCDGGLATA